jgi:hypothetical protein
MLALSPEQFRACTGVSRQTFGAHVARDEVALAFGHGAPLAGGTFVDLDCLALLLIDELEPAFTRKFAAAIVRMHGDEWLKAVGRADTIAEPVYFFVFEHGDARAEGKRSYREKYRVSEGPLTDFANLNAFATLPQDNIPARFTGVNVSDILRRVRLNAARAGLDMSAPFFPPPGDPLHEEIVTAAKKQRDAFLGRNAALALFHQHRVAELEKRP